MKAKPEDNTVQELISEMVQAYSTSLNYEFYSKKIGELDDLALGHKVTDVLKKNGITEKIDNHVEYYPQSENGLGICPFKYVREDFFSGNALVKIEITRGKTYNHRRKGMLKIVMYSRSKGEVNFLYNSLEKKLGKDES